MKLVKVTHFLTEKKMLIFNGSTQVLSNDCHHSAEKNLPDGVNLS